METLSPEEVLRRERCLLGLANATRVLLRHSDLSTAFPRALEHLRAALDLDRLYICKHETRTPKTCDSLSKTAHSKTAHSKTGSSKTSQHETVLDREQSESLLTVRLISESLGQGIQAHSSRWQDWSYEQAGLSRWYATFWAHMPLGGILSEFPNDEQGLLRQENIKSALMVPIFLSETELWGYLGCDNCTQAVEWSPGEQSTLVAFADNLGSAICRQRGEEEIQFQAFHDLLTGLPNRVLFNHRLPLAIAHARRHQEPLAVMYLDLDRFKQINDTLGHDYGDQLLIQATQRLKACLREEDILARWGGDEFTLCLPNLLSSNDVITICQRLLEALRLPFYIEQEQLQISGSIGIALYPQDGHDIETLLSNADKALYQVKENGRDHYQFFRPAMNSLVSERLAWGQSLRQALEQAELCLTQVGSDLPGALQLYYQPQANLQTGQVESVEALLRWQHPQMSLLSEVELLPHIEEAGLEQELGQWMIAAVVEQRQEWARAGLHLNAISFNLSTQQFQSEKLMAMLSHAVKQPSPIQLCIELDQPSLNRDAQYSKRVLDELSRSGLGIALDQFGVEPVDIATLAQLPLHSLKLRSLKLDNQGNEPPGLDQLAYLTTLRDISKSLSGPAVADGIESQAELELLRSLHFNHGQGDFLCPPLPASALQQQLREDSGHCFLPSAQPKRLAERTTVPPSD